MTSYITHTYVHNRVGFALRNSMKFLKKKWRYLTHFYVHFALFCIYVQHIFRSYSIWLICIVYRHTPYIDRARKALTKTYIHIGKIKSPQGNIRCYFILFWRIMWFYMVVYCTLTYKYQGWYELHPKKVYIYKPRHHRFYRISFQ